MNKQDKDVEKMTSIKSKMPLVAIILLICVVIFFTVWNITYEKQMLQRILILYDILIIFVIVLVVSRIVKSRAVFRSGIKFGKSPGSKLHYFRCPNCNGIFTIKESKGSDNISFVITCPYCRTIGRMQPKAKSV